ncbi:hypothetical protein CEXT_130561 [Caerostris extrusa]|uniref:Uncharacterized protein n=1 Tax=Caerostris extrusa TaxID=172846 RepID=A0AAV4NS95_CAEEX|nr:hypothetical protein CEXT_130561 [Caerostris extrusa]
MELISELQTQLEFLHNCVPLAKLPATPAEAEKIKLAVEERRNPKPPTSQPTEEKPRHQSSARPSKAIQADKKKPKRRIEDDDGFILPAKHLVARNKPATPVPTQISSSNTNILNSTNPTPKVADEVIPTEQLARKPKIPPLL